MPGEPPAEGPHGPVQPDPATGPPVLPEFEQRAAPASAPEAAPDVEPVWYALLRNRLILSGIAAVVVLLLIAAVLLAIGRGDGAAPMASVADDATPEQDTSPAPGEGLSGVIRTTTAVRNGPGSDFQALGTIPRGTLVPVVGRNEDVTWLQVVYPPGTDLRGWVSIAVIEVTGDISSLTIAGPGPGPSIDIPTSAVPPTPVVVAPTATEPAPTDTPEPTRVLQPTNTLVPTSTRPPPTETPEKEITE